MFLSKRSNKQNEELEDQLAVYQERNVPRYAIKAGISIEGFDGEGLLTNISVSGCNMESITYVSILPEKVYQVKIIPDQGEDIKPFSLKLKLNWTKSTEALFQAGFSLEDGQTNTQLKRYVDYLETQGIKPDFGHMSTKNKSKNS